MTVLARTPIAIRFDPAFVEAVARRALLGPDVEPGERERYAERVEACYLIGDDHEREQSFRRTALAELEELGLVDAVRRSIDERPPIADRVRVVLVAEARGRTDEGVTWEPSGEHLGIRVELRRFADPGRLMGWLRHVLGHVADTADPAFGFIPGRAEAILGAPAQARFHRLWDVSVDARLGESGHGESGHGESGHGVGSVSRQDHRTRVAADLPGTPDEVVDAVLARLWDGPRPTFEELLGWSVDRSSLAGAVTRGRGLHRPDRCPLCGFLGEDVVPPDASLARLVNGDYPDWRPESGICGRCADRYRFLGITGGGS